MVTRNNPNPVRESSLLGIGPYRYANTAEDSRELNRVVRA